MSPLTFEMKMCPLLYIHACMYIHDWSTRPTKRLFASHYAHVHVVHVNVASAPYRMQIKKLTQAETRLGREPLQYHIVKVARWNSTYVCISYRM